MKIAYADTFINSRVGSGRGGGERANKPLLQNPVSRCSGKLRRVFVCFNQKRGDAGCTVKISIINFTDNRRR